MSKKFIPFFIGIIFFSGFHPVFAGLVINEIMYDLSGSDSTNSKSREWIEVYNPDSGDISIDASKWRINDGTGSRTINGEVNFSISSGSFVIFAGDKDTFLLDHPGFSGVVYDTGITSLNNTGATLKILDQDLSQVDSVTYASTLGGAGDGNSLQKISGSWLGTVPTPGTANAISASSSSTTSGTGGLVSNSSNIDNSSNQSSTATASATTIQPKNKISEVPGIKTKINAQTLVFAGIPVELSSNATGLAGEKLNNGKYFWNFGDGDSKEVKTVDSQKFMHTYFYPGEYDVSLEYFMNPYLDVSDAYDRITIKVVPADISISSVGDEKDFFIELDNNTDYDANLSNWILGSAVNNFTIPRNTIIGSKKKIIVSSKITSFSILDKNTLKLMTPGRVVVFNYAPSITPGVPIVSSEVKIEPKVRAKVASEVKKPTEHLTKENVLASAPIIQMPVENLEVSNKTASTIAGENFDGQASAIESNEIIEDSGSMLPTIISLIFIGTGAGAVYLIRQKRRVESIGDDFNILDE